MTGAPNCSSVSAPSGSTGSIQEDVTSDLVRFVIFLGCFSIAVTSVMGLISGHAEDSQRSVADTDLLLLWMDVLGPAGLRYPASVDEVKVVTVGTVGTHGSQSRVIGLVVLDEQATSEAVPEEVLQKVDDELFLTVLCWSELAVSAIQHGPHGLVMLAVVRSLITG